MRTLRIGELAGDCGFVVDGDWVESKDQDPAGEVRLLQLADVGDGVFLDRSNRYLTADKAKELRCTELSKGDVLVARLGDPVGKACVFPGSKMTCVTVVDVCIIRADPKLCVPEWLVGLLSSPPMRAKLTGLAAGATRARFPTSKFRELEIQVPHPDVQRRVASHLAGAMESSKGAIDGLEEQVRASEKLPSAILLETFGGTIPIGPPMKSDRLCHFGWEWKSLRSVARLESGHTPSRRRPQWWGGNVPWLALPDIRKLHGKVAVETSEYTNDEGLANSSARLLPINTVCVSRTASIGFVTLLGRPMATSQDFCNWICDREKLDAEFLMYAFMASQDQLRELGSGAVHKTIYMPTIESFRICAPALPEQRRIARRLREQLVAAESLQAHLSDRLAEIQKLPHKILAEVFRTH